MTDTPTNSNADDGSDPGTTAASSTYKLLGEFAAADGAGVLGTNTAGSGTPIGVEGAAPNASGGYGLSTPDDVRIRGVLDTDGTDFVVRAGTTDAGEVTNVVRGHASNRVGDGAYGVTVAGGGYDDGSTVDANAVHDNFGTIVGGRNQVVASEDGNLGLSVHTSIGGGRNNDANDSYSAIGGGRGNIVYSDYCYVGGGSNNESDDLKSVVLGGTGNGPLTEKCAVGGGTGNEVGLIQLDDSVIVGGANNELEEGQNGADRCGIGGGKGNRGANPHYRDFRNAIFGGEGNVSRDNRGVIGGGNGNLITGADPVVGGGTNNGMTRVRQPTIGGGDGNEVTGNRATVCGGRNNAAISGSSVVIGGRHNRVEAGFATVAGGGPSDTTATSGTHNAVYDEYGAVGGGGNNRAGTRDSVTATYGAVAGGRNNATAGQYAAVAGGRDDETRGNAALTAGHNATASDDGAFVWADGATNTSGTVTEFDSAAGLGPTGSDTFNVRATGGARIATSVDASGTVDAGVKVGPGDGSWSSLSASAYKTRVEPVDPQAILAGVRRLDISRWEYDSREGVEHLGPMAEAFYDEFELGDSREHLANVDADGVALATIQALSALLERMNDRIAALEADLATLEAELDADPVD